MSFRIRITNFRALRSVDMVDDGSLSIVVGPNESGKSTLKGAIQYAFSGTAYGRKGREDVKGLISHGADRLAVDVTAGGISASRTTATGDPLKQVAERLGVPEAVLPLLFDSEMAGDCGTKAMQAFMAGAASSKFDPIATFAKDQDVRYYIDLAYRAGKFTTKHIIEFCETNRAAQKEPPKPVRPGAPRPDPTVLAAAEEAVSNASAKVAELEATQDQLNNTGSALDAISNFLRQEAEYLQAAEAAKAGDPLGLMRAKLTAVKSLNTTSIQAVIDILAAAGSFTVPANAGTVFLTHVIESVNYATQALANNPPPVQPPPMPVLPPTAITVYTQLKAANSLDIQNIGNLSAALSTERQGNTTALHLARESLEAVKARRTQLTETVGAWKAFDEAEPSYVDACVRAREQWARWDNAAKKIKAAEEDFVRSQGAGFGDLVNRIGAPILQGRRITVDPVAGVSLGIEPMGDLSKSTRWRVEAAVCAAIAVTMKSPLLVLDGADILDDANRIEFITALIDGIAPLFKHTIVTVTRSDLEREKPLTTPGATKWLVRNGAITKCVASA
jgi:hypothetical protein